MTMPDVPVSSLHTLYDPVKEIANILRDRLVELGLVPSGEHVVYGPGKSDESEPLPPRVCIDIEDDFSVDHPQAGATNYGPGIVDTVTGSNDQGAIDYEIAAHSVASIEERMIVTIWARMPEDGEQDPTDLSGYAQSIINRRALMELRSRVISILFELLGRTTLRAPIQGRVLKAGEGDTQNGAGCVLVVPFVTEVPSTHGMVRVAPTTKQEIEVVAELPEGDVTIANVRIN